MARPGGHRAEAFAAILFERLIDTIALVFFGLVFWFWSSPPYGSRILDVVMVTLLVLLIGGTVFGMSPWASALAQRTGSLIPWNKARGHYLEKSEKVLASIRSFRGMSPGGAMLLITLTVARHMLSIMFLVCFAISLGLTMDFPSLGWIRSFVNIVTTIPLSFAGLGVREGSMVILMQPYGVAGSEAVAVALFLFLVHVVFAVVGGIWEMFNVYLPSRAEENSKAGS